MILIATEVQAKKAEPLQIIGGVGLMFNRVDPNQKPFYGESIDPETTWGGALMVKGSLNPWFEIEGDLIFGRYQFIRQAPTQIVYERCTRIHVPILFRVRPLSFLSIGAGPYASYRMGTVAGPNNVDNIDLTSAHDLGEHGLEGAFGISIPIHRTEYLIGIDFRYNYNLTPRASEKDYNQSLFVFFQSYITI